MKFKKYWAAFFMLSLLIVPGLLPTFFNYLVTLGLVFVPKNINQNIFNTLAILFYLFDVPVFLMLYWLRCGVGSFALLGASAPILGLILISILNPIATLADEELAKVVFKYCVLFIVPFGVINGFVFWLIRKKTS